ncbi:hypothetical protein [Brachybacterium sp. ACRRE]|uniref:hypothetical protein n=1 Tax=Brachybacterium sp. ACRRE TaxID=2918184 RepID=UPI001EF201B4|nr:hypothetical protein [Brachybacterium sp. ACRRE]MCG7308306.1 hypothetical protein [Brachybacterium sp. ACRRE]
MSRHSLRRNRVKIFAATALVALTASTASASAEPANTEDDSCSETSYQAGDCLWFAASPGEDPLTQGVGQAIERGDTDVADKFIAKYSKANDFSSKQTATLRAESKEAATPKEAPSKSTTTPQVQMKKGGGTTSGFTNTVADTVSYGPCGLGSCKVIGKTHVDFRYELEGVADFSLVADFDVKSGPKILLHETRCRTRFNHGAWPDQTVHTWGNCKKYGGPTGYLPSFSIHLENWGGGTRGEIYHPDYRLSFNVKGGADVTKSWRGHDYKIRESGSGRPYWV